MLSKHYSLWKAFPFVAATLLTAVLLCSCSLVNDLTLRPLPQVQGRIKAKGLHSEAEVLRDKRGVPHIYANDSHDLFFAQGFTQAQDRWWQMELYRRIAAGRLSELIGKTGFANDAYLRTLRVYATAEKEAELLDVDSRAMFDAFAEGVNAYILTRSSKELAMEYAALRVAGVEIDVEPWTAADSLSFGKILQLQQSAPMMSEATYETVLNKVGPERVQYWIPSEPYGTLPSIGGAAGANGEKSSQTPDWISELMRPAIGSTSWVASASLTKTGRPILENDPHLTLGIPSLYYEIALHSIGNTTDSQIDAAGFAFPSSPGIIIGHNTNIGWGLSIGKGVDQWDTYHVTPNPERPLEQYRWNGEWADYSTRDETFKIAQQSDVTISVRETVHGPIINDVMEEDPDGFHTEQSGNPMALQWTCLEPGGMGVALRHLITAKDWDDFRSALSYWDSPPCNFSYADISGNIGYQLAAKIPLRAKDDSGLVPRDGSIDSTLWKGYLPFDYAPHSFNPKEGLIVNANQAAASEEYFDWLSEQLGADFNAWFQPTAYCGYRAERIWRLLEGAAPYSLEYFASMQSDAKLPGLDEVTPCLAALKIDDATLAELRDWLLEWDGKFSTDSSRATFYALFWTHLLRDIYKDEAPVPHPNDAGMHAVNLLLQDPANAWWDDAETSDVIEDRDAILLRALFDAAAHAASSLGSDRDAWKWGNVHTIKFVNLSLGSTSLEMMTSYVNRGPYPFPGGMETINLGEWTADTTSFGVVWASCVRMILDVGNWDDSLASLAPGQSGHPASPNYADQIDDWRMVEHHKMAWRRDNVLKATEHRLYIEPK